MKKQAPTVQPTELTVGPLSIKGQLPFVACVVIGLLVGGGLVLFMVVQYRQPSILIDPLISHAVSATMTAEPTATQMPTAMPSASLMMFNTNGSQILPERGEYRLRPGQNVDIQVTPFREGKKYKWTSTGPGKFEPEIPTGFHVTFAVPESLDQQTVILVCELDEHLNPVGSDMSIIIRATAK